MRLTMTERKAVVRQMATRYQRAGKKEKGRLLDELVALTGYSRWYAVELLGGASPRAAASSRWSAWTSILVVRASRSHAATNRHVHALIARSDRSRGCYGEQRAQPCRRPAYASRVAPHPRHRSTPGGCSGCGGRRYPGRTWS